MVTVYTTAEKAANQRKTVAECGNNKDSVKNHEIIGTHRGQLTRMELDGRIALHDYPCPDHRKEPDVQGKDYMGRKCVPRTPQTKHKSENASRLPGPEQTNRSDKTCQPAPSRWQRANREKSQSDTQIEYRFIHMRKVKDSNMGQQCRKVLLENWAAEKDCGVRESPTMLAPRLAQNQNPKP